MNAGGAIGHNGLPAYSNWSKVAPLPDNRYSTLIPKQECHASPGSMVGGALPVADAVDTSGRVDPTDTRTRPSPLGARFAWRRAAPARRSVLSTRPPPLRAVGLLQGNWLSLTRRFDFSQAGIRGHASVLQGIHSPLQFEDHTRTAHSLFIHREGSRPRKGVVRWSVAFTVRVNDVACPGAQRREP